MITHYDCPLCKQNNWLLYWNILLKCKYCGLVRSPDKNFLFNPTSLYNSRYFKGKDYLDYSTEKSALTKNFAQRLSLMQKQIATGKILDVGCAYGYFLELAKRKGFRVEGVEVNSQVAKKASICTGAQIHVGDFLKLKLKPKSYEMITLFDVVEHLKSPSDYLQKAYTLLKKHGRIVVETGDVASSLATIQKQAWRLVSPQIHLYYFSGKTLSLLLRQIGFKNISIQKVGFWRTAGQIVYRSAGKKWLSLCPNFLLSLPIYLNTNDLILVTAEK